MKQPFEMKVARERGFPQHLNRYALLIPLLLVFILSNCSKNPGSPEEEYGTIAFAIKWEGDSAAKTTQKQVAPKGVVWVRVRVGGGEITPIVRDFDANLGEGTVTGVPVGRREVIVHGLNNSKEIITSSNTVWLDVEKGKTVTPPGGYIVLPRPRPDVPELISPSNGARIESPTEVIVEWRTVDADSYLLQVSRNSNMTELVLNQSFTQTSVRVYSLDPATTYYWRVRAQNESGLSDWSLTLSFTTHEPVGPPPPQLNYPVDGAEGVWLYFSFEWEDVDAVRYHLQISQNANMTNLWSEDSTITEPTSFQFGFDPSTTYYWRVRCINAGGKGPWSPVFSFTTTPVSEPPPVAGLVSPGDGAIGVPVDVTLEWRAVGAVLYRIQVSRDLGFEDILVEEFLPGNSYFIAGLEEGTTYYWRVGAWNEAGASNWSAVYSFTTSRRVVLAAPTIIRPQNGATNVVLNPLLEWSNVGAEVYEVVVSHYNNLADPISSQMDISGTSFRVEGLKAQTTYYWRVRGRSAAAGTGSWSVVASFTTRAQVVGNVVFHEDFKGAQADIVNRWPVNKWMPAEDIWIEANGLNIDLSPGGSYYFQSQPVSVNSFTTVFRFFLIGVSYSSNENPSTIFFVVLDKEEKHGVALSITIRESDIFMIYLHIPASGVWEAIGSTARSIESLMGEQTVAFSYNASTGNMGIYWNGELQMRVDSFTHRGNISVVFMGSNNATDLDEYLNLIMSDISVTIPATSGETTKLTIHRSQ